MPFSVFIPCKYLSADFVISNAKFFHFSRKATVVAVWTLFSKIFSFYIGHFWKLSYIYGSLAAIVLITLWLNVNINVLFLGAGLNAKIQGIGQEKKGKVV